MTGIYNHKTLIALAAISAIAAALTGSAHMASAFVAVLTGHTTNTGVNVQTDTNQKQDCLTTGGSSPISMSCTANSNDRVTQSGGLNK